MVTRETSAGLELDKEGFLIHQVPGVFEEREELERLRGEEGWRDVGRR